jgi:hypothetical protein
MDGISCGASSARAVDRPVAAAGVDRARTPDVDADEASRVSQSAVGVIMQRRGAPLRSALGQRGAFGVNTRTIAIIALIIAVIVLLLLLL